jgi:hypothetical protein
MLPQKHQKTKKPKTTPSDANFKTWQMQLSKTHSAILRVNNLKIALFASTSRAQAELLMILQSPLVPKSYLSQEVTPLPSGVQTGSSLLLSHKWRLLDPILSKVVAFPTSPS